MEDSVEVSFDNIDDIPTLRLILDSMGVDEDGIVVVELSEIPMEEGTEDGYSYYHYLTVLANKLEEGQTATTLVNLNRINVETLLGSYQIVEDAGTVTHKYVLRSAVKEDAQMAEDLYNCLVDIVAIVNNDYDRVLASIE